MAQDSLASVLEEAGERITRQMVDSLYEQKAVITGKLANSITPEVVKTDTGYKLEITMLDYGFYVDEGSERKAGKPPPVRAIIDWIERAGITPPSKFPNIESFAYAIRYNIGEKGQRFKEPKPFITPSVELVANQFLPQALEEAGLKSIEQELDKILK